MPAVCARHASLMARLEACCGAHTACDDAQHGPQPTASCTPYTPAGAAPSLARPCSCPTERCRRAEHGPRRLGQLVQHWPRFSSYNRRSATRAPCQSSQQDLNAVQGLDRGEDCAVCKACASEITCFAGWELRHVSCPGSPSCTCENFNWSIAASHLVCIPSTVCCLQTEFG